MAIPSLLATINLSDPVTWAVLIGWVLSVAVHEFAHGLVAYLGGDYTIRDRGGLTLNPVQYVHPLNSIVLPLAMLAMGGVPLPGGATYVRRDLLRNRAWDSAVSLAGPAANVLLFFAFALPLHPHLGWVRADADPKDWTTAQQCLGALATLQCLTTALNLIPIPPLDGFQAIAPFLGRDVREKTSTPAVANAGLAFTFVLLCLARGHPFQPVYNLEDSVLRRIGMGDALDGMRAAFNAVILGR